MARSSAKKEKRTKHLMAYFIVLLMVTSVLGMISMNNSDPPTQDSISYGKYHFVPHEKDNIWSVKIDNIDYYFNYFPTDVDDIYLDYNIPEKIKNSDVILFTYDSVEPELKESDESINNIEYSIFMLRRTIELNHNHYARQGLTDNVFYPDELQITCNDAKYSLPVIYFKQSNKTGISLENDCIIIEGANPTDFLKLKDRLNMDLLLQNE